MKPVRTRSSNFVYRGPAPDIGDAWVERRPAEQIVYLVWWPTPAEREQIAAGGNLKLGIFNMEPIPPVSLEVTLEDEVVDHEPGHRIQYDRPPKPPAPPEHREVG